MLLESEVMEFYFPLCSALQTSPKHSFVSIMDPAIYPGSTAPQQGFDCRVCVLKYESYAYQNVTVKNYSKFLFVYSLISITVPGNLIYIRLQEPEAYSSSPFSPAFIP